MKLAILNNQFDYNKRISRFFINKSKNVVISLKHKKCISNLGTHLRNSANDCETDGTCVEYWSAFHSHKCAWSHTGGYRLSNSLSRALLTPTGFGATRAAGTRCARSVLTWPFNCPLTHIGRVYTPVEQDKCKDTKDEQSKVTYGTNRSWKSKK